MSAAEHPAESPLPPSACSAEAAPHMPDVVCIVYHILRLHEQHQAAASPADPPARLQFPAPPVF